ncbi:YifB family Mg chelatase-like AAA ATPase [Cycloclasticus pugetii]|uniref:YifB family Mg chelatase-like AAA ATPase n=1 Tax=Cycloclasticus pugetii TaxID=34068 RepID=UPI000373DD1E|nr:YifB family Mg chelatase-like AAA ATPase [Cycloclasticus pugetii]
MSLATTLTRSSTGINAPLVTVEAHLANGLPSLNIVGLPEAAVKESKDRVRSAILNCQFEFPAKRITINLAPADLPKEGGRFDLPIALCILAASGQIPNDKLLDYEFLGELSLSGELRAIKGALPTAIACQTSHRTLCLPTHNQHEAALISSVDIIGAPHLLAVCSHLHGQQELPLFKPKNDVTSPSINNLDFSDVHGQQHTKRALEIAAAGRHSLLMLGPPGTGKSMLAARLPSILPLLSEEEAIETASIYSISQHNLDTHQWRTPPFRSPHHSASSVALVGGGSSPKPGEVSLAHHGVLFLDELPEFDRKVLEVLREPIENGKISISRANHQTEFPARFQLIAAMNPCPCGYLGDTSQRCQCNPVQISRYRNKISGPLLDRIDMHIEVPRISSEMLRKGTNGGEQSSAQIALRVHHSQIKALKRQGQLNELLSTAQIKQHCQISDEDHQLLEQAIEKLGLSHRAYHRILRVSRTIADMDHQTNIQRHHLTEALSYRRMDKRVT